MQANLEACLLTFGDQRLILVMDLFQEPQNVWNTGQAKGHSGQSAENETPQHSRNRIFHTPKEKADPPLWGFGDAKGGPAMGSLPHRFGENGDGVGGRGWGG